MAASLVSLIDEGISIGQPATSRPLKARKTFVDKKSSHMELLY